MVRRLELHEELCKILGNRNVYFQPPATIKLNYPCIIYNKTDADIKKADDKTYIRKTMYTVTVIDRDPDSTIPDKVEELPYCSLERYFINDNLNHTVFQLYY